MKEWLKVKNHKAGVTVTCTLVDGNLSVTWSAAAYASSIPEGVQLARAGANQALADLKGAIA